MTILSACLLSGLASMHVDYSAYAVLFVDPDPERASAFRFALGSKFRVRTAAGSAAALEALRSGDVAVVLGTPRSLRTLRRARDIDVGVVRILLSPMGLAREAEREVRAGHAELWLSEPWSCDGMESQLRAAIELVDLQRRVRDSGVTLLRANSPSPWGMHEELAHELANPLAALGVNVEYVLDQLRELEQAAGASAHVQKLLTQAREAQEDAIAGAEQLRALVSRLRTGAGPSTAPPKGRCDVRGVVSNTVRLVRKNLGADVAVHVDEQVRPVAAMETSALRQIVLNLLGNASNAVRGATRRHITVRIDEKQDNAVLRVSDTGPGVSKEIEPTLFDRGVGSGAGNGLGLSIVRELVTQVGGQIELVNEPGQGATFVVSLPKSAER